MKKKKSPSIQSNASPAANSLSFWPSIIAIVTCLWAGAVILTYDKKFPSTMNVFPALLNDILSISPLHYLNVIPQDIYFLVLFLLSSLTIYILGAVLLPSFVRTTLTAFEHRLVSMGLGVVIYSTLIFLIGVIGGYQKSVFLLFDITVVAVGGYYLREILHRDFLDLKSFHKTISFSISGALLFILCLIPFLMAFVPEAFYDSLVYHVGLPQLFVNEGRMVDTPYVYFSRFPMLVHMLYVPGVAFSGSILPKLSNWLLFILAIGVMRAISLRLQHSKAWVWAGLFYASIPVVQMNVASTAVDSAQSTFALLAVFILMLMIEQRDRLMYWSLLLGVFSGAVFAVKYTGVVFIIAMGSVLIFVIMRRSWKKVVLPSLLIFSVAIGLVMAPYLIRNFIWTGNPTYPILSSVIKSRHLNVPKVNGETYLIKKFAPRNLTDWIVFPWAQTMREQTSFNFIGPMVLAGLPLLLLGGFWDSKEKRIMSALIGLYFIIALLFSGDVRYLLAGFSLISVFLGIGVARSRSAHPVAAWILRAVFIAAVGYQLIWVLLVFKGMYDPLKVILGEESKEHFSATMHNGLNLWPWNSMTEDIKALPAESRVYILGNEQVFGFPRRFYYSSVHDDTPLVLWANESANVQEFLKKLNKEGITHILFNIPEAYRLKGYDLFPWTDQGRRIFLEFAGHNLNLIKVKPIMDYKNCLFLFEVRAIPSVNSAQDQFEKMFGAYMNLSGTTK